MNKFLSSAPVIYWTVADLRVTYRLKSTPIPIRDSQDAAILLYARWDKDLLDVQEQIAAMYLNNREEVIGFRLISTGKLHSAQLDTPLLLATGLLVRAKSIILCHNHPSGDPTPSKSDIRTTIQLCKATQLVGMELYDHIILSREGWHSMADSRNFIPCRMMRRD